jgi:hypothetical protein
MKTLQCLDGVTKWAIPEGVGRPAIALAHPAGGLSLEDFDAIVGRVEGGIIGLTKYPPRISAMRNLYAAFKWREENDGLPFTISHEEFHSITSQPCYYCGTPPQCYHVPTGYRPENGYAYNGVVGMDADLGIVPGNAIPCCGKCSRWKRRIGHAGTLRRMKKNTLA